jgi:type III pantothenate kinase
VINDKKEYLGGAIAPGIGISLNALVEKTAQLPKVEMTVPDKVIGKTTVSAIQSGLLYGYCGLVDGMVHRIAEELGYNEKDITVVATGGLAEVIHAHSHTITEVDQMLTLKGLLTIYHRNEKLHHTKGVKPEQKDGALC